MGNGQTALLRQISTFASSVPLTLVEAIVNDIECMDTANWTYARGKVLQAMSQPEARAKLGHLLDAWHTNAPECPPKSVALALLAVAEAEEHHRRCKSVELVWTGPDSQAIALRRTDQALLQVIEAAYRKLLIVSFAVYKIPEIATALVQAAERGVEIKICVESPDSSEGRIAYDTIRALGPQVASCATVYVWPLSERPRNVDGKPGSLHVKCAVADTDLLFISSANLTEYALTLNMELGVLMRGGALPGKVATHFERFIEEGVLVAV